MVLDEFLNGRDQLLHVLKGATANAFVGDLAEPAFGHEIQPGTAGGDEMHLELVDGVSTTL